MEFRVAQDRFLTRPSQQFSSASYLSCYTVGKPDSSPNGAAWLWGGFLQSRMLCSSAEIPMVAKLEKVSETA
jgi:hypothetical protein